MILYYSFSIIWIAWLCINLVCFYCIFIVFLLYFTILPLRRIKGSLSLSLSLSLFLSLPLSLSCLRRPAGLLPASRSLVRSLVAHAARVGSLSLSLARTQVSASTRTTSGKYIKKGTPGHDKTQENRTHDVHRTVVKYSTYVNQEFLFVNNNK